MSPFRRSSSNILAQLLVVTWLSSAVGWANEAMVLPVSYGFSNQTFKDVQGNSFKYILFVPFDFAPESRPPLLVYLNGLGENGNDGTAAARGPLGT